MMPPWIVCAWPPVLWQAEQTPELRFEHLGTCVVFPGDAERPRSGQTVWGDATGRPAGVAWDWVEVQEGVVAMADPFGLVTNLKLLDRQNHELPTVQAALRLNGLVHTLPWQSAVWDALHGQLPVADAPRLRAA